MATQMTDDIALRYSTFTTDENLTPDSFIVFQDMDKTHSDMVDRYYTLKNKIYTTDSEKLEMTQLEVNLQEYLPTSDTWNKLCACIMTMQMFLRDGVVIFINEKKEEFQEMLKNYKYVGDWDEKTTYFIGNSVRYNGFGFLSIVDNNLNQEPNCELANDGYWIRFTIKGDKGDPSLNVNYKGDYVNTTTYNLGDACTYNGVMYYAKQDGTSAILPTDNTKWAYVDKIVISDTEPIDTHVIWWDTIEDKLKRYTANSKWESAQNYAIDLQIADIGNYYSSTNVEGALQESGSSIKNINNSVININTNVTNINNKLGLFSEDSSQKLYYRGSKVGATNANEINLASITGMSSTNVQAGMSELFQFANNGKTSVANVVGYVSNSNTFGQISNEIQYDKNILANNLSNKGVSANGNNKLRDLANEVANITLASMNGVKYVYNSLTKSTATVNINLGFQPKLIILTSNNSSYVDMYSSDMPLLNKFWRYYNEKTTSDNFNFGNTTISINSTGFTTTFGAIGYVLTYIAIG